jgi:hypothetical protein
MPTENESGPGRRGARRRKVSGIEESRRE